MDFVVFKVENTPTLKGRGTNPSNFVKHIFVEMQFDTTKCTSPAPQELFEHSALTTTKVVADKSEA